MRSLAIVTTIVQSLFFSLRLLLMTHFGESPVGENCFPQYFGITRSYMQKKSYFKKIYDIFNFFTKKSRFSSVFLLFMASVRSRPPGPPSVRGVLSIKSQINDTLG